MWKKKSPSKKLPRTAVSLRVEELGGRIVPTVSIIDTNLVDCDISQAAVSGQTEDPSNKDQNTTDFAFRVPVDVTIDPMETEATFILTKETDCVSETEDPALADGTIEGFVSDSVESDTKMSELEVPVDENGDPFFFPVMYCMGGIESEDGTVSDFELVDSRFIDIQPYYRTFSGEGETKDSEPIEPEVCPVFEGPYSELSGEIDPSWMSSTEVPGDELEVPVDENGEPLFFPVMYTMGGIKSEDGTVGDSEVIDPRSIDIQPYYRTLTGEGESPVQDPSLEGETRDDESADPEVVGDSEVPYPEVPGELDPSVDPKDDNHLIYYTMSPGDSEKPQEGELDDPDVIFQTTGGTGNPLSVYQGSGQGTYEINPGVPDIGKEYSFQGTATIPGFGEATVEGSIRSLGSIRIGQARGILTFTNARGSVTVSLLGPEQAGFSDLPGEFAYRVVSGTGDFLGANGKGAFGLTLDETNNQWSAELFTNQLTGSGTGTFTIPVQTFVIADAGTEYEVQGGVELTGIGQTSFSGTFNSLGFALTGNATGHLDLTNAEGTVSLSLKGPEQKGFSQLPSEFEYTVESATGEFESINPNGKFVLTLNPDGTVVCNFGDNAPIRRTGGNDADQLGLKVDSFYRTYLNRESDSKGRSHWVSLLNKGVSSQDVVKAFLTSEEYFSQQGTSREAYIKSLYNDILGRDASSSEVALWLANWDKGLDSHGVLEHILNSDESFKRALNNFYQNYLDRDADQAGFSKWFKGLKSGQVDLDEVALRFLNSPEYQGKNGPIMID